MVFGWLGGRTGSTLGGFKLFSSRCVGRGGVYFLFPAPPVPRIPVTVPSAPMPISLCSVPLAHGFLGGWCANLGRFPSKPKPTLDIRLKLQMTLRSTQKPEPTPKKNWFPFSHNQTTPKRFHTTTKERRHLVTRRNNKVRSMFQVPFKLLILPLLL